MNRSPSALTMMKHQAYLGIDIGSVSASCVLLDQNGSICDSAYRFHEGNPVKALLDMLDRIDLPNEFVSSCTSSTPDILHSTVRFDTNVSIIRAAGHLYPTIDSILIVGGERFGLVEFDETDRYKGFRSNTSCAAGTGSFLDQQARRLDLDGSAALSELAMRNRGVPPNIASRCSVFAKTDIIHAQQEGYSLEEICDGLCLGLSRNVSDALFKDKPGAKSLIFVGGVSRNKAVRGHLERYLNVKLKVHENSHLFGAIGAGLCLLDEHRDERGGERGDKYVDGNCDETGDAKKRKSPGSATVFETVDAESLVRRSVGDKHYFFEPLRVDHGDEADDESCERIHFISSCLARENPVEIEIFGTLTSTEQIQTYLGIDIGSTSTKAVLIDVEQNVLAGFYTRTAGKPVRAAQALFESIEYIERQKSVLFEYLGTATTGSGRSFIGKLIGADVILDEISAHARAAYELNPKIDTIIEIGGQDSKFTTMKNGMVTFSQMNTVCAAGTGSFLEEQAARLGVPISEYAERALGAPAPLTSDRCTVFMERDINSYFHKGYTVEEILAAALFSVRENYLLKVATQARIGEVITFQGATARNKALVAAFKQKLDKPIFVSRYCHLTGALGAAIHAIEEEFEGTTFRGTELWNEAIPVTTEFCTYCRNHCRITLARVGGERVAYGFLCGRDYDTHRYVERDANRFSLLRERKAIVSAQIALHPKEETPDNSESPIVNVGIPSALHLAEDIPFWTIFFHSLGIDVISSESYADDSRQGRRIAGAEFCAPMAAFHAHSRHLSENTRTLFIPIYLEDPDIIDRDARLRKVGSDMRLLCYYSQYAPSLVKSLEESDSGVRCIMPVLDPRKGRARVLGELYRKLKPFLGDRLARKDIEVAYRRASTAKQAIQSSFRNLFLNAKERDATYEVAIFGRPYTVLQEGMNGRIPDIIASKSIRAWSQDMLPASDTDESDISELLKAFHWNYPSRILAAAEVCARSDYLYPILITSFRCSPDSFLIDFFKNIFERYGKPYLILQLDEHDSSVGYETRIEAALRTFSNHHKQHKIAATPIKISHRYNFNMVPKGGLAGKTLFLPNWDSFVSPLVAANLRWAGYDVRPLVENEALIRESMRHNTGQCIPVSIILEEFVSCIRTQNLDPAKSVVWMGKSGWSCNLPMFPYYIKSLLESYGPDMTGANVYMGELTYIDFSPVVAVRAYLAYLLGGMMRRLSCKIRPYETVPGNTDAILPESKKILEAAFSGDAHLPDAVEKAVGLLEDIPRSTGARRKAAIFGDLYVRDNDVLNQDLVRFVERSGGEVITTPYNVYMKIVSRAVFKQLLHDHDIRRYFVFRSLLPVVELLETRYARYFDELSEEMVAGDDPAVEEYLNAFNVSILHDGESRDNILKIFHLVRTHPDLSLFIQTNPAFCCPSLITEAMSEDIERITGVPVVSLTYDGTGTFQNDLVVPYLQL